MMNLEKLRNEALAWVKENGPSGIMGPFPNRSCWHCNAAHDWMKTDMETPYQCFDCGNIYFKGQCLTPDEPAEKDE
jgi:hypothetical protein